MVANLEQGERVEKKLFQFQHKNNRQEPVLLQCWWGDVGDAAARAACESLLQELFAAGLDADEPADARILVWRDQALVASAACRLRQWSVADKLVDGAHVGYVCSHPDYRGQGYALAALQAVMQAMMERVWLPGVLHCVPALVPFYAQAGWITVAPAGVYQQADGSQRVDPDPIMAWDPRPGKNLDSLVCDVFPLGSDW